MSSSRKTKDGKLISSIVPELPLGSPVTVPRHYADYVVTEFGIAHLRYKYQTTESGSFVSI